MTTARPPRRTHVGPSAAAAAIVSLFTTAALVPGSADAAQDPDAPPPPPSATTTPTTTSATPTVVEERPATEPPLQEQERETQFDDSFDLYLVPGVLNMPFGGEDDVDYGERFNPGYQWGVGMGWFERGEDNRLAIGIGGFFDHAILNSERRVLEDIDDISEHVFRVGLELRPGIVIGERLFLNVPIRGGYAARTSVTSVRGDNDVDLDVDHGPHVGIAGGIDLAIYRGLYIGTAAGADFHFFRAGRDHDFYTVGWRALLGYRF